MEKWKRRVIELITSLAFEDIGELSVVPYYPQKTEISRVEDKFFSRTIPEKKGISSARLYKMLCELEGDSRANIHSIMVLCGKEVICECSAEGYSTREWHISHSMSKTICGMIIGRLISEGRLHEEDTLVGIFPEIPYRDKRFPLITVEHLLSMTAGVDFAEAGAITESEWTRQFFMSAMRFSPGSKFFYNSMNSYMLVRIAERASGRRFSELAKDYIFDPLGIENYLWEIGPEGSEKGGWGLYMSAESWAKVGVMFLGGGMFLGQRVLPEEWVEKSSAVKAIAPKEDGSFNYGYQMWVGRDRREILFNGMFGQNVWICPQNDIVVVTTSGNNELFQASAALEIIRKYLGGRINDKLNRKNAKYLEEKQQTFYKSRMWAPPLSARQGILSRLGLINPNAFDRRWLAIVGSYKFAENNASLQPMIIRGMQNNLDSEIKGLRISRDASDLLFTFFSRDEEYKVHVGLYGYRTSVVDFAGEKYIIRAIGRAMKSSEGKNEFRVEMIFPETASTRRLIIKKESDGRIEISLSEVPSGRIVERFFDRTAKEGSKLFFLIDILERRLGKDSIKKTIERIFNPKIIGTEEGSDYYTEIIERENKRRKEQIEKTKLVRTIIDRFFKGS